MTAPVVLGDGQVRLDEVYLAGSTGQGPAVVGGLGLLADVNGLTVLGPQPSSVRTMPWGRASTIACHRLTQLPDGTPAVMLEVDIDGSALRFFVPQRGLGSEGAVGLERRLTALSRVPVAPSPPVGIARDGSTVNAPSRPAQPQTVSGAGAQAQAQAQAQVQVPAEAHAAYPGKLPPGLLPPGALPPATGGTLSVSQGPTAGQYVQAASRRRLSRKSRIAAALVVILVAGGAAAYVVRSHTGTSSPSGATSADALAAAQANLAPGDVPGWRGVPGTIAGPIGAFGFKQPTHAGAPGQASTGVATDAAGFARCTRQPGSRADAALAALGFAQGIAAVPGETALSSSPLFVDPSVPATSTVSSVIVLGSTSERAADASVFADGNFAGCYSFFLTAAVPSLVGGATSAIPLANVSVRAIRVRSSVAGVSVAGFSETFYRKGRPARSALFGTIDVVARGRMIAVLQTISSRAFPAAEGTKLLAAFEQNVAGETS